MRIEGPVKHAALTQRVTGLVIAYFAASAAAMGYVRGSLWSLAAYHEDPIDIAWRLELIWRALRGEWSLLHFQYPRGPLWQLAGALAGVLGGGDPGWTLALLHLGLQWLSLGVVTAVVFRGVRPGWGRALAVLGAATLTDASGIATFRAFLPLAVVVIYLWPTRRVWASAFLAAGLTLAAALVSLDRLPIVLASVTVAAFAELLFARVDRTPFAPAARRFARHALATGAGLGVLAAALVLAGVDLETLVREQLAIGAAYAGGMSAAWRAAVVREHVALFFGGCLAVGVWAVRRDEDAAARRRSVWLLACAPGAAFALVRTDPGHIAMSLAPLVVALYPVALGGEVRREWRRGLALGLAAVATTLWFVEHPDNLAGHPRVLRRTLQVARGERRPAQGFESELAAAMRWVEDEPGCVAVSADISALHALADRDGPTVLSIRWDDQQRARLADSIVAAHCPRFVYSVRNYPTPGTSWPFGADFVEVARHYGPDTRLGVSTLGMRRRAEPLAIDTRAIGEAFSETVELPGELRVPLRETVRTTDLIEVELELSMGRWRAWAGGTPLLEWRFERDGQPVSGWRWAWPVGVGRRASIFLAPDTEAAEWHWMGYSPAQRPRPADTLAFRLSSRGIASPESVEARVHEVRRWRRPAPPDAPAEACVAEADLTARVHRGDAYVRFDAPRPRGDRFTLRPRAEGERLAEVVFDVTPCADTCVSGAFALQASDVSDGAQVELHAMELPARSLVFHDTLTPGASATRFEASLAQWTGRPVLLRFGALRVDSWWYDNVQVIGPRISRCTARRPLSEAALPEGVEARGEDLAFARDAPPLEVPFTVVRGTCLRAGVDGRGWLEVQVGERELDHVLVDRAVRAPVPTEEWSLHDFVGRSVTLRIDARRLTLIQPALVACGATP